MPGNSKPEQTGTPGSFCPHHPPNTCTHQGTPPQSHPHQATAAGPAPHRGGHRADRADGGTAGTVGQRRDTHGHALGLLGLGRAGGWEADADYLVDGCKETELGWALEVPVEAGETTLRSQPRSLSFPRLPHLFRAQQTGSSSGSHHPYPNTNRWDSQKGNRGE